MTTADHKLTPWEREIKAALGRQIEHEADEAARDADEAILSREEHEVQKAKLMARARAWLDEQEKPAESPITEWQEEGRRWLRATMEGIVQLKANFNPTPILASGYRRGSRGVEGFESLLDKKFGAPRIEPTQAPDSNEQRVPNKPLVPWIPVALLLEDKSTRTYRLQFMYLGDAPKTAPVVSLFVEDKELDPESADYDRPPMFHLYFRTEVPMEEVACSVGVMESDEGGIEIRINRTSA